MSDQHQDNPVVQETQKPGWHAHRWRIAAWSMAAMILLLPLIAMQFTDEVQWNAFDFAFAAILIFGTGLLFELALRKSRDLAYRGAVALALAGAFMLIWVNGAVGIIGNEDNIANLMFLGVIAVALIGAFLARFQPLGMARALFGAAIVQALVGIIALFAGLGTTGPIWPFDILGLTGFFVVLFAASALLFRRAAQQRLDTGVH